MEAERARKAAPDKKKLQLFVKELKAIEYPSLDTTEADTIIKNTKTLILKVENYLNEKIKNL